jgi:hypothetical protein
MTETEYVELAEMIESRGRVERRLRRLRGRLAFARAQRLDDVAEQIEYDIAELLRDC